MIIHPAAAASPTHDQRVDVIGLLNDYYDAPS